MWVKFEATDAAGKVHKRSSKTHVYSHCVVIHLAVHPPGNFWPEGVTTCSHAEWVHWATDTGRPHFGSSGKLLVVFTAAAKLEPD